MDKIQAFNSFWNRFLKAYDENSVPDNAQLPYITYEIASDDFNNTLPLSASIWYRSTSWEDAVSKEKEIASYIGRGGKMITYDEGALWIRKGSPWAQRLKDDADDMIRRIILNIQAEYLD